MIMIATTLSSLSILLLFIPTDANNFYGSSWELAETPHHSGTTYTFDDNFYCNDNVNCVLKCYTSWACNSMNIYGPKGASLTIYCDSWRYVDDPSSLPANERMGGSCYKLDIFAHESTSLTINCYQGQQEMYWNSIVTPNNGRGGGYSTNIQCGLTTSNSPDGTDPYALSNPCGSLVRLYSVEGWNDVNWHYASGKSSSLVIDNSQQMRCGESLADYDGDFSNIAFDHYCIGFAVNNGRYGCESYDECDSYTLPTEKPTKNPTTSGPTESPTMPTVQPTGSPFTPTSAYPTQSPVTTTSPTAREYVLVTVSTSNKMTWVDAEAACQSEYETHLATIITSADLSNVLDMMDEGDVMDAWIGLNDRLAEGHWEWSDGSECFVDSNSCCQFWSSTPSDTDDWGASGADCAMLRDDSGGILYEMQCDTLSSRYADGYLCNAPDYTRVIESSTACKAVYLDGMPTFPLDICLGSENNGVSVSSKLTCNEFGEPVALEWSGRSDCLGAPDSEEPYSVGEGVDCEGPVCDYAVMRIYDSTSCTNSGSFSEYPVTIDNCHQYDASTWVQYECDGDTLNFVQYSDQVCGGSSAAQNMYTDGDCDDSGRYYAITCNQANQAVSVSLHIAVFISFIAIIFEANY
eukprot:447813_1